MLIVGVLVSQCQHIPSGQAKDRWMLDGLAIYFQGKIAEIFFASSKIGGFWFRKYEIFPR